MKKKVGKIDLIYETEKGRAYRGDSRDMLRSGALEPESADLVFTSPPFALTRPKDYGNKAQHEYVEWFMSFLPMLIGALSERGSLVIDIGGSYLPGSPIRSVYHFELAARIAQDLQLCQEFYWYNPSKLPSPAQYTNVDRVRVKDSVNLVLWYARDASVTKANNRRVLKAYSKSMKSLLKSGYQARKRPSNHDISANFARDNKGAIPPNLLGFASENTQIELLGEPYDLLFDNLVSVANTASNTRYLEACRNAGLKPHPARFPLGLPAFFIQFLTEPGDLIFDPFAGSNTTGKAAEDLGRRWVSCDLDEEGTYVVGSAFRFEQVEWHERLDPTTKARWDVEGYQVGPQQ